MSTAAITWTFRIIEQIDELTASQKLVLVVLADHHNGRSGQCTPSMARIGARSGLTERAARLAVRDLENLGLVVTHKRSDKSGQTSNQYDLFGPVLDRSGRNKKTARGRNAASGGAGGTPVPTNLEDSLYGDVASGTGTTVRSPAEGTT